MKGAETTSARLPRLVAATLLRAFARSRTSAALLFLVVYTEYDPRPAVAQCEVQEDVKLIASAPQPQANFGRSVAVSGDVAVFGAYLEDCADGPDCGAAYVYRFNGSAWIEQQRLSASDPARGDQFGFSVAVSGNVILIGARAETCPAGFLCGSAYIFHYGGGNWVNYQKLSAPSAAQGDEFGFAVALDGEVAAIGSQRRNCMAGGDCGAVFVYRFDGSAWLLEQTLVPADVVGADLFGHSVSVRGDLIIAGAIGTRCAGGLALFCGSARIFRFNGVSWIEEHKLSGGDQAAAGDIFGACVSISAEVALVGAPFVDCLAGADCGTAYFYRYNGIGWNEEQMVTPVAASANDQFGVSLDVEGNWAFVGSPLRDGWAGANGGAVYGFYHSGSTWAEVPGVGASHPTAGERMGYSLSFDGNALLVGAPLAPCAPGAVDCGAAYLFSVADCEPNGVFDACDPDLDEDALPDGCDPCPFDNPDDFDGDGVCDSDDPCPLDNPDDPDGDGVCSSAESCPNDLFKTEPGLCGCGVSDADSDADSVPDCRDLCPGADDTFFAPECTGTIPAMSSWGMLILAMLLLTTAKIRFQANLADAS